MQQSSELDIDRNPFAALWLLILGDEIYRKIKCFKLTYEEGAGM